MTKQVEPLDFIESQKQEAEPLLHKHPVTPVHELDGDEKVLKQPSLQALENTGVVWPGVAYFTLVSGSLLVINKIAIEALPAPKFLLLCQLVFSALAVGAAGQVGAVKIGWATPQQLLHFLPVVIGFIGTVYSNFKVLQHSNVETFITFRSSTPVVLSFCDWAFLGRELPCLQSWVALAFLVVSTAGYAAFDSGFVADAYAWIGVWYCFFTFDCVWNKHLCNTVPMSNWARVFYSNLLSAPIMALWFSLSGEEQEEVAQSGWGAAVLGPLALSCIVGALMSHASYKLRSSMSAATAALVGIACKLLSVVLNTAVWDKHAGPTELAFLAMGMVAAAVYKQAPLRKPV